MGRIKHTICSQWKLAISSFEMITKKGLNYFIPAFILQRTIKDHPYQSKIINHYLKQSNSVHTDKRPLALLIGGGTASGKTSLRKTIIPQLLQSKNVTAVVIDPDDIKELLPQYSFLKKHTPEIAASTVHKESREITSKLLRALIQKQHHFIYEGTMARATNYISLIKSLKAANYEIHLIVVDVPLEVAKKRAKYRAKKTGREVPQQIIEKTHQLVPITFELIKDQCDRYQLYDNQAGLLLIASNVYVDNLKYQQFLKKAHASVSLQPNVHSE